MYRKIILLVILISLVSGCKKDTASDSNNNIKSIEDLLVKNNEITGWAYAGAGWTANNISELTNYIDGAAPLYERHGFVEASYQKYSGTINNNPCSIELFVYNQGTNANASALYKDPTLDLSGAVDWTGGAGSEAKYLRSGGLSQIMVFYSGQYFVRFDINTDTDESLSVLKQFALNVDNKIKGK